MNQVDVGSAKNLNGSVGPLTKTLTSELAFKLKFRFVSGRFVHIVICVLLRLTSLVMRRFLFGVVVSNYRRKACHSMLYGLR